MFKYLDVLIGLALVMVLVSPMVTAFTQICMWGMSRRCHYLYQMLVRLITQFDRSNGVLFEVVEDDPSKPKPVEGVRLVTKTGKVLRATDANGHTFLPEGIAAADMVGDIFRFETRKDNTPTGNYRVVAVFVPQASLHEVAASARADNGKAVLTHTYSGAPALASRTATIAVKHASGSAQLKTQTLQWSLNGSQKISTNPGPTEIALPEVAEVPFKYEFEFELLDANTKVVPDETVEVQFRRFDGEDRRVESSVAGGVRALTVPGGMDEELAKALARAVAKHPLLARTPLPTFVQKVPPLMNRDAEVVEREQLIRVLLELAANEGTAELSPENRTRLRAVLNQYGIPNPAATLSNIRSVAQQLEDSEPTTAAHIRNTRAIAKAAQSDFVGKINHWFDSAAARATQQYAAEARAFTIVGALVVAMLIQLDTLGLLHRLSSEPALRDSLVAEARTTQEKIDKAAADASSSGASSQTSAATTPATGKPAAGASSSETTTSAAATGGPTSDGASDDLALSKAKLEEIERNLATLRSPPLSLVPDHFLWQRLHRGRLERNPTWAGPYPANLFLVTGGSTYTVPMRWRRDPLADIKASIDASGAPVRTEIVTDGTDIVIRADEAFELHAISRMKDLAAPAVNSAQSTVTIPATADKTPVQWFELKLDDTAYPVPLAPDKVVSPKSVAEALIASRAPVVVQVAKLVEVLVQDSGVQRIQLLHYSEPASDLHSANTLERLPAPRAKLVRSAALTLPNTADDNAMQRFELRLDKAAFPLRLAAADVASAAALTRAITASGAPVTVMCFDEKFKECKCLDEPASSRARHLQIVARDQNARGVKFVRIDTRQSDLLGPTTRVDGYAVAMPVGDVAQAVLDANLSAWPQRIEFTDDRPMHLMVDNKTYRVKFSSTNSAVFDNLSKAITALKAGVVPRCFTGTRKPVACSGAVAASMTDKDGPYFLEMTATDPRAREIRLLSNPDDPYSNVLGDTTRVARTWRISSATLVAASGAEMSVSAGSRTKGYDGGQIPQSAGAAHAADRVEKINALLAKTLLHARAREYSGDDLLITAKRLGPVQLRHSAGQAESNMLNTFEESRISLVELVSRSWDGLWSRQPGLGGSSKDAGLLGIFLTWVLLSLGAPFWYDALKNLLKLRPTSAATEEKNRTERTESRGDSTKQGADTKK